MKHVFKLGLTLLGLGAALAWGGIWYGKETCAFDIVPGPCYDLAEYEWHQRLTIVVDTPQGPRDGAAVQMIWWQGLERGEKIKSAFGAAADWRVTGEAAAVEVAPGRWLFALLRGANSWLGDAGPNFVELRAVDNQVELSQEEALDGLRASPPDQPFALTRDLYPLLVTFDDINDPKTVRRVDPDDLDASFGCDRGLTPAEAPWRAEGRTWANWAAEAAYRQASAQAAVNAAIPIEDIDAIVELSWLTGRLHSWQPGDDEKLAAAEARISQEEFHRWEKEIRALNWGRDVVLPTPVEIAAKRGGPCHQLKAVTLELTEEPVTPWQEGQVAKILPQAFFETWGAIHKAAVKRGINDPYFDSFLGGLRRGDFQRVSTK